VIIVRGNKIAALYVFLDCSRRSQVLQRSQHKGRWLADHEAGPRSPLLSLTSTSPRAATREAFYRTAFAHDDSNMSSFTS
jgi:hypothetical protein